MDSKAEAILLARVVDGDAEAFNCLLDQHIAGINRFAYRMLNNSTDAEDVTQEVFIRLWERAAQFDSSRAQFNTWLYQIAHNLCIDIFRKKRFDSTDDVDSSASETNLHLEHESEQERLIVQAAVAELPERQRSALLLCHFHGLSNKQAGVIMELSVDAVESLLARARRKLKSELQLLTLTDNRTNNANRSTIDKIIPGAKDPEGEKKP